MKKIKVKGGLNIPLHTVDNLSNLEEIRPKFNAVLSEDYFGLKPKYSLKKVMWLIKLHHFSKTKPILGLT